MQNKPRWSKCDPQTHTSVWEENPQSYPLTSTCVLWHKHIIINERSLNKQTNHRSHQRKTKYVCVVYVFCRCVIYAVWCMYMSMQVCTPICGGQKKKSGVFLCAPLRQSVSPGQELILPFLLAWLARELLRFTSLCLLTFILNAGVTRTDVYSWLLKSTLRIGSQVLKCSYPLSHLPNHGEKD